MIETSRLYLKNKQSSDNLTEDYYLNLYPDISELDPTVGKSKNPIFYSIFTKDDNRHIGICCLYNFTITTIELGVRIFIPEYWSKGYGTEIVNALSEIAFNLATIESVYAKTPVYNVRAIKCYEKCQFIQYTRAMLDGYDMVFMRRLR